jgi:rare lipoprotein A (peptidoglycan hydrolase)
VRSRPVLIREKALVRRSAPTLSFVLLVFVLSVAADAQTQPRSDGSFEERFLFDRGRGDAPPAASVPESGTTAPGTQQKAPASVLKELIIPPAEAEPATSSPSRDAASPAPAPASRKAVLPVPAVRPLAAAPVGAKQAAPKAKPRGGRRIATGAAAFYEHPGRTASGEKYNPNGLTAAHRSLPLGTRVRVVNLRNNRSVIVRINDRTPPKIRYVIDLSRGSAQAIGIKDVGQVALYASN